MKVQTKYNFTVRELWLVMVSNYKGLHTTGELISMQISNELWNKIREERRKYLETRNRQSPKHGCDVDNTERDGGGTWAHRRNWGNMGAHGMET